MGHSALQHKYHSKKVYPLNRLKKKYNHHKSTPKKVYHNPPDPMIIQSIHKNIFRATHDGISSKWIAKQLGKLIYGHHMGSNISNFDKNHFKYCFYEKKLHNLNHLIIQSNPKNTFRTKHDRISSKLMTKQ